jgi:hypothetical protein
MIRIKPKLTTTTSYNTLAINPTTSIDKYVCKNNRFALNDLYKLLINNNENLLFKKMNKIKIIEDLFNLSCLVGDEDLLDKVITFIQTTTTTQTTIEDETFKLTSNTIYYAIKGKNLEILKKLKKISNYKLGEYLNEDYDETSLIRAIKNQQFEQVQILVETFGVSLNQCDSKKRTPLHFAASYDNVEILEYLVRNGANINSQCVFNDTPLISACLNRKYNQVEVLISYGASVDTRGNYGNGPMHTLVVNADCNVEVLKKILKNNVDLCLTNDKEQTCFVRACSTTNLNLCKLLLAELLIRYSKQQPHSFYFKFKKLKVKTNFEFLNTEIINGLLNATCYLRLEIVKYLFKFVNEKILLCNELKNYFENKILVTIIQRKDINEFSLLFKLFMSYGCMPVEEKPLFYVNMLIKYWNVKLHMPSTYSFEPLEVCIQDHICLLIYYGFYGYKHLEQIYFELFPGVDENIILYSLCASFRKRFGEIYSKPKTLKLLAKNVIRGSMVSLSEKNLLAICLPCALKDYLVDFI